MYPSRLSCYNTPDMPRVYYVFESELGWVGIAGANGRICRLVLPRSSRRETAAFLNEGKARGLVESKHDFSGQADRLAAYFAGKRVDFDCEPDTTGASPFDVRVWGAAREIGYGEVRSYGWLAARIGQPGAARAVGQALGRNPVPVIVPCHRVIRSDGGIGGFGAGLAWKIRLLGMEASGRKADNHRSDGGLPPVGRDSEIPTHRVQDGGA